MLDNASEWGGYREGAGRKSTWNYGATKVVKFPELLMSDITRYARLIDGSYPDGLQLETALSCNIDSVTQSSQLQALLQEKSRECDRLNRDCDRLSAQVGDLLLELDEMRSRVNSTELVTQSSGVGGSDVNSDLELFVTELKAKVQQKLKGYTSNSFSKGIKDILSL